MATLCYRKHWFTLFYFTVDYSFGYAKNKSTALGTIIYSCWPGHTYNGGFYQSCSWNVGSLENAWNITSLFGPGDPDKIKKPEMEK